VFNALKVGYKCMKSSSYSLGNSYVATRHLRGDNCWLQITWSLSHFDIVLRWTSKIWDNVLRPIGWDHLTCVASITLFFLMGSFHSFLHISEANAGVNIKRSCRYLTTRAIPYMPYAFGFINRWGNIVFQLRHNESFGDSPVLLRPLRWYNMQCLINKRYD